MAKKKVSQPKPETEPQLGPKAQQGPKPQQASNPKPQQASNPKPQQESKPNPQQEPKLVPSADAKVMSKPKRKPKPKRDTKPKPKAPKPEQETRTSFMFPELHDDVLDEISDELPSVWFNATSEGYNFKKSWETHVMGVFQCNNGSCRARRWSSKRVAIWIRGYANNGYNAVVFNQRCQSCNELGTMTLNKKAYAERIAYRLMVWAGIPVERPHYTPKESPPHRAELCEGCKSGRCLQAEDLELK